METSSNTERTFLLLLLFSLDPIFTCISAQGPLRVLPQATVTLPLVAAYVALPLLSCPIADTVAKCILQAQHMDTLCL